MTILPKPITYTSANGVYTLPSSQVKVDYHDFTADCISVFSVRTGHKLMKSSADECHISIDKNLKFRAEEYEIVINERGIKIEASTENSVVMAFTTLYQLMDKEGKLSFCHIHDEPRYAHRGLSLDCARQFFSISDLKNIIEQMSRVKLNTLHWHLSNDQAWRIESKRFPKLHQLYGAEIYKQTEITEIVEYASVRGIKVVPEINTPGHAIGILAAYPEHSCSGKEVKPALYGGVYATVLCPGNEKTYRFMEELFAEICPLFPSSHFHIGGDEVPKHEWVKCEYCQNKIKEQNLKNEIELQGYFSNRIIAMIGKHNKQAISWNDSLEAENFNRDATIQYWTVQYEDSMPAFIEKGGKIVYSEMFSFYFDYPVSMTPLKRVYQDALEILGKDCSDAIIGIEACLWAEHIRDANRLGELLFPRLYAVAERAWSSQCDYADFIERLSRFMAFCHDEKVSHTPQAGWDPIGESRQQETLKHMGIMAKAMPQEVRDETMSNISLNDTFQAKFSQCFFNVNEDKFILEQMNNA